MGGKLVVESELGKGSTFRVSVPGVPVSGKEAVPGSELQAAVTPEKLPKRVLVLDDSPVNRKVLSALLKKAGIAAVDSAGDGAEALEKIDLAAKAGAPYDFIFSDLWMPNMNGLEFIGKLRADPRFARLPVYAVTADTEFRRDARSYLFTGILLKPVTYAKLLEVFAATE